MDNILEGKAEVERVIYNDPDPETGFLLLPDLKWSRENIEDLYVLAIVRKKGLLCLRELNANHLLLLENLYAQAKVFVCVFVCLYVCVFICLYVCVLYTGEYSEITEGLPINLHFFYQ